MTADAKVGLLLGLVFIVIIAFVINGLPDFVHSLRTDAVVETAVTTQTQGNLVIDPAVLDAAHNLQADRGLRYSQPPGGVMTMGEFAKPQGQNAVAADMTPQTDVAMAAKPETVAATPKPDVSAAAESVAAARPAPDTKTHIVQKGQTLAVIAKIYYGAEQGNKLATIQRLYQANSDILKSPDTVKVGDKLAIPVVNGNVKKESAAAVLMNKFRGVFEPVRQEKSSPSAAEYIVRSGDNLWGVAQTQLGDGHRYSEIIKLNSDRISNADDIQAGMRLRMPKR